MHIYINPTLEWFHLETSFCVCFNKNEDNCETFLYPRIDVAFAFTFDLLKHNWGLIHTDRSQFESDISQNCDFLIVFCKLKFLEYHF